VLLLYLLGGVGGIALSAQISKGGGIFLGGNGAALALLSAWAIPDLRALARRRDYEGDLLGTAVFAAVIALMPLAAPEASWISAGVGVVAGVVIGYPLARLRPY
jgi:hypothetical protein